MRPGIVRQCVRWTATNDRDEILRPGGGAARTNLGEAGAA